MEIKLSGSFAPPLAPKQLAVYRALAQAAPPSIADAMVALCDMMEMYHGHPPSTRESIPHRSGIVAMTPLESHVVAALDPWVPWLHECKMYGELFAQLDPVKERDLRNAAHHLLWHAVELTHDREPLTTDRLPKQ